MLLLMVWVAAGCKDTPTPHPRAPASLPVPQMQEAPHPPSPRIAHISFATAGHELRRVVTFGGKSRPLTPLSAKRVDALVVALRDALEFGPPQHVQPLWRLLHRGYQLLLANAEPELDKANGLVIHATGLIRFIPFHALLREEENKSRKASFVISRWPVSYLPPDTTCTRGPRPRQATVLLPTYGRKQRPLRSGRAEAQLVRLNGHAPTILMGRAATAPAMLAALRIPRGLVHFAGHALPNLEDRGAPELIFGPEHTLGATALREARVKSSLVVLASCTTAYAARFRGKKPLVVREPLPELLLHAGAGAVIAASWGVKDAQSRAQMETFYRHLERRGPAEALALAQRERIARLEPPHPRYWAFYALYGARRFENEARR